jgi:hypothetical protein
MRKAAKWLGVVLVALAAAVLPFVIWVPGSWAIMAAVAGTAGAVLLLVGLGGGA